MPDPTRLASFIEAVGSELFPGIVADWERTCDACPAQFEGKLRDGRAFYFRYRHGVARLGFGPDRGAAADDPNAVSVGHGDGLDGSLTDAEFRRLFVSLALLRLAVPEPCTLCGGTGIVPGSEDYDYTVHMHNPSTGEPCDCQLRGEG